MSKLMVLSLAGVAGGIGVTAPRLLPPDGMAPQLAGLMPELLEPPGFNVKGYHDRLKWAEDRPAAAAFQASLTASPGQLDHLHDVM